MCGKRLLVTAIFAILEGLMTIAKRRRTSPNTSQNRSIPLASSKTLIWLSAFSLCTAAGCAIPSGNGGALSLKSAPTMAKDGSRSDRLTLSYDLPSSEIRWPEVILSFFAKRAGEKVGVPILLDKPDHD